MKPRLLVSALLLASVTALAQTEPARVLAGIPGMDFSKLPAGPMKELATVFTDEFDWCGRPLTVAASLKSGKACKHTQRMASMAAGQAMDGAPATEIIVSLSKYNQSFGAKRTAVKPDERTCKGPKDAVVSYLGARILQDFVATVLVVELVSISVMREFGVVITAILLAGRTNSSFTAEIGAMKMRQEIDAMRVIGIDPMDALVAPRVIAMNVMMPILTFAATMSGMFGVILVSWASLGVSPNMFIARVSEVVPADNFWVGFSKAPAFALVLAVIACKQGLSVGGDLGSLGDKVTTSVVQASSWSCCWMRCLRSGSWRWAGEQRDRHSGARSGDPLRDADRA